MTRKASNAHIWAAGTFEYLAFLIKRISSLSTVTVAKSLDGDVDHN